MFEIEYLKLKNKILQEIYLTDFETWKYLDQFGNVSKKVEFKADLERELIKLERYDLLINLRDD